MANQSSFFPHKTIHRKPKDSKTPIGLSKSSSVNESNILGSTGNQNSHKLKNMDSTPVLGPDANQHHKRRCLEKLAVRKERNVDNVNCALEVEVIDDTALIEATASVTEFKNRCKKDTDVGLRIDSRNDSRIGGYVNRKKENDGKKKRNKGSKKLIKGCSMKCVNEKKGKDRVVEDRKCVNVNKVVEGKSQKVFKKVYGKVKYVYRRKDAKNQTTGLDEHQKVETQNVPEKTDGECLQEIAMNLNVPEKIDSDCLQEIAVNLNVPEKIAGETLQETEVKLDSAVKIVGDGVEETEANLNVSNGDEKEKLVTELAETEMVNVKDDATDVHTEKNEAEDRNVSENSSVGSKKFVYSREEMEALRFVDEEGQKNKWTELYNGFEPSVAREYTGLVLGVNNWPTQRYNNRVVNCGSTRHANAILGMSPVLPLCSPSIYRKFDPYDRVGFRSNFH